MIKVLFVYSNRKGKGISPFIESQLISLVHTGCVNMKTYCIIKGEIIGYLQSIVLLNRFINKENIDIIHAHYNLCGIVAKIASIGKKTKVVVSFMGDDLYGTYNRKNKLTFNGKLNIILAKIFIPFYDGIIVKSNRMLDLINTKYHAKLKVVPNGVDFEKFQPIDKKIARLELGLKEDQKYVLYLNNRNDPRKNYALFKEALKYVNNDFIELSPYPIPHDKVSLYINACDVFVQVSKLEGSSNLVKEAIACNSQIVVTDVGDAKELLQDVKGSFISSFDAKEIGNKIDLSLSNNCNTNSRERNSGLEINLIANRIIEFYQFILIK